MRSTLTVESTSPMRRYPMAPGTLKMNLRTPVGEDRILGDTRISPVNSPWRKCLFSCSSVIPQTSRTMALRSGSPGSRMTRVIRRPLAQWLRLPRNILRNSEDESSSTGLERLTTMTSASVAPDVSGPAGGRAPAPARTESNSGPASKTTAINTMVSGRMRTLPKSEGKAHLERELAYARLVSQKRVVVLEFQGNRFTGVIAKPRGGTVAQRHIRKY